MWKCNENYYNSIIKCKTEAYIADEIYNAFQNYNLKFCILLSEKMNLHIIKSLYNYKLFGSKIDISQQLNLTCTSWLHPIPDWIRLAGSCRRSISQIVVWVARVRNCFPVSIHRSRHHSIWYSTGVATCDFFKKKTLVNNIA